MFIGSVSAFCNFYGTFLLDAHFWTCCHQNHLTNNQCFGTLLPIIQLFSIWICSSIFYIIFVIYLNKSQTYNISELRSPKYINLWFIIYVFIFPICIGLTATFLLVSTNIISHHIILYGNILNITSCILTLITWTPQIYITYKCKGFISLSPITLFIQASGSLIIFIFEIVLNKSNLSISIPFMIAGLEQFIIFGIGTYYYFREKKRNQRLHYTITENDYLINNVYT